MKGDTISLSEALDLICQRTGKTRRQAKRELLEKLRTGELPAFGTLVKNIRGQMVTTGRHGEIDPEFWQDVPAAGDEPQQ